MMNIVLHIFYTHTHTQSMKTRTEFKNPKKIWTGRRKHLWRTGNYFSGLVNRIKLCSNKFKNSLPHRVTLVTQPTWTLLFYLNICLLVPSRDANAFSCTPGWFFVAANISQFSLRDWQVPDFCFIKVFHCQQFVTHVQFDSDTEQRGTVETVRVYWCRCHRVVQSEVWQVLASSWDCELSNPSIVFWDTRRRSLLRSLLDYPVRKATRTEVMYLKRFMQAEQAMNYNIRISAHSPVLPTTHQQLWSLVSCDNDNDA